MKHTDWLRLKSEGYQLNYYILVSRIVRPEFKLQANKLSPL